MTIESKKASLGLIGLAVMGQNLALNIADHGFPIAVFTHTVSKVSDFIAKNPHKNLIGTKSLEELVQVLEKPRRLILMIKAGDPVDEMIAKLKPLLEAGDIIIDGGNSWFKDTQRREAELSKVNLNFFGSGVSGGEEGARLGPSLMPGGSREAYEKVRPVFEAIAAQTNSGPCVTYVGPNGAGHFVKMIHNGIEYGDMQLIAEAYDLLKRVVGLSNTELAEVFQKWNQGILSSFLIEITAKIFSVMDPETKKPLVDLILDQAGQKGTGKWTVQIAMELGVAIPTITAAIDSRAISSMKEERVAAAQRIPGPAVHLKTEEKKQWIQAIHDALYASKICSYAQGMRLIQEGSKTYHWNINLRETARIWKGGCIIRAVFLDSIMKAFEKNNNLPSLILDDAFLSKIVDSEASWRKTVALAVENGIPVPSMSASLAYFDSYRTAQLPQNLTQAQRDLFGAHTFQRIDHPERGFVHFEWLK
jgi:6-phosphogluconate dehydrogenase